MMCLGWKNRPSCKARPPMQVTPGEGAAIGTAADNSGSGSCSAGWFWLGLAAIAGMAVAGKGGGK